jgi:renalase
MVRVAIVGAGVAGLRLGGLLQARGLSVELFDKARGPAGRIATRRLDGGRFDHGAQYFTARQPVFVEQVRDWVARDVVAPWTGRIVTLDAGAVHEEPAAVARYVGVPSMSAIARDLASGLTLEAGVRIASVRRMGTKWLLVADDGFERGGFDLLVSAVPAPQAPPFLASSTEFTLHAQRVQFAPCHAAMVEFAEPVEAAFDAAFVKASPLGWVAREASKPGREASNAWVLHSTADWSRANVDRPADQVRVTLLAAFATVLARALPELRGAEVHRWLYARAENPVPGSCLWDPAGGLGVCGDWLRGDRIEDAFLSAERLAEAILASREGTRAG